MRHFYFLSKITYSIRLLSRWAFSKLQFASKITITFKKQSQAAQLTEDFRELAGKIVAHTPRPVYIKEVATMFIDEIIQKGDFVGIHWRYDLDDWLATNCKVKELKITIISINSSF